MLFPVPDSGQPCGVADPGCEICAASGTIRDHLGFRQGPARKGPARKGIPSAFILFSRARMMSAVAVIAAGATCGTLAFSATAAPLVPAGNPLARLTADQIAKTAATERRLPVTFTTPEGCKRCSCPGH